MIKMVHPLIVKNALKIVFLGKNIHNTVYFNNYFICVISIDSDVCLECDPNNDKLVLNFYS